MSSVSRCALCVAALLPFAASGGEATRALRIGASGEAFFSNPFEDVSSSGGAGLSGVYEFLVSPRTSVGLALSVQIFFGRENIHRFVYGVELKHYFSALEPGAAPPGLRPYLAYGLLQQLIGQRGHSGSAVAYDAGLIAGTDFPATPVPLFVEAALHVSHLSALDQAARSAIYGELTAGVRIAF
jgi:hypothetical protein